MPRARNACVVVAAFALVMVDGIAVGATSSETTKVAQVDPDREASSDGATDPRIDGALPVLRPFALHRVEERALIVAVDRDAIRVARDGGRRFVAQRFPLDRGRQVDLELEPFRVVAPGARFVVGSLNGADRPFDFDPTGIQFFRGTVSGEPNSSVFLTVSDTSSAGYVDLGPAAVRYRISSKDSVGRSLDAGQISVFRTAGGMSGPSGVPLCGVEGDEPAARTHDAEWEAPAPPAVGSVAGGPAVGLRQLQLAVETDYELYLLFNDLATTATYVVQMYGEVSNTYLRDVKTRVEVVFVRIWDTPDDLFNGPDPLGQFYPYWAANMGGVPRDNAQLFSGRRDYPFGGQAFLSSMCQFDFGYGIVGYAVGSFPDPSKPDPFNWDVHVCAHELGHSCDALHTHDEGLDTCQDPGTTPRRGSIMSYCGQTWSGMNANMDNHFHVVNRQSMTAHLGASACIALDCNMNSVADNLDIANATSADTNGNGVPDECEDCNANGILDPAEISGGAPDTNGNGIPDSCEPDCNGNSVPDDRDLSLGTSSDAYGDGIPDECDADCNSNGISDYNEIQSNMPLDRNRNAILDSCEDCDVDGTTDAVELNAAHGLWVASGLGNSIIRQFHASTGVLTRSSTGASISEGQDLIVAPGNRILVTSALTNRVVEFNPSGAFVRNLVATGAGGLSYPTGLLVNPTGRLLVCSRNTNQVLSYDLATGTSLGVFVSAGSGGLTAPFGLTYGPNGNLFVTSSANEVLEYHGMSGAFVREFVSSANNGGLLSPRGLAFKPDGNLLVASYGTDELLEYDGETGWPRGKWAHVGTETAITQDSPWGIRVGPNGHVYVARTGTAFSSPAISTGDDVAASHLTDARMFEYSVCNGDFRKTHIGGNDHGLNFTTGFDFIPGWSVDCNLNDLPDSCDIASGTSLDGDSNGIPDECQVDCNGNGMYDHRDLYPRGSSRDCNCNFVPDECDLASASSTDCNSNGTPDECEVLFDCDGNAVQDICDIAGGAADCNGNGLLDSCELARPPVLMDVNFEPGLPAGWSVSGIFTVSESCAAAPTCNNGLAWAYAGHPASCSYGDGEAGGLMSPPVDLPPDASAELRYCSRLDAEADFDYAEVVINNTIVERLSGTTAWQERVVDLTPFAGRSITVLFRLQSDGFVSGTLGWQVDNVRVTTSAPCVDCDNNGVIDVCVCSASSAPAAEMISNENGQQVVSTKNRFVSFSAGDPGRTQAVRMTFVALPAPWNVWNGRTFWVDQPTLRCETAGVGPGQSCGAGATFRAAELTCAGPEYANWSALGTVHVHHPGIVPGGHYRLQVIDQNCPVSEADFSAPLEVTNPEWGDAVGAFNVGQNLWTAPDGDVDVTADVVADLEKFGNRPGAPIKARADVEPCRLDLRINISDVTRILDAFRGLSYPYAPGLGVPPCPSDPCAVAEQ